jgi:hypothetical protein
MVTENQVCEVAIGRMSGVCGFAGIHNPKALGFYRSIKGLAADNPALPASASEAKATQSQDRQGTRKP